MTIRGTARGKTIELDEALPIPSGQKLTVRVEAETDGPRPGSAAALLEALRQPPHLTAEDIAELNRAMAQGKSVPRAEGIFDDLCR